VDLAWTMLPRIAAFKQLHDGGSRSLMPDSLYTLALTAFDGDEELAEALRDGREESIVRSAADSDNEEK
jgi:hypothetical protein